MKKTNTWFSIIEVLVGMLIFSLGLVAVLVLIFSSMNLNDYNKNYIIASNLAREQIELVKNIRDSNYNTIHNWNQIDYLWNYEDVTNYFSTWTYYTLENDFATPDNPIIVKKIENFWEGINELNNKMKSYKLCLDNKNRYTYDCSGINKQTKFYRYLYVDNLNYSSGATTYIVPDAFVLKSKVIWYIRGYHEVELKTILTDWKRL